MLRSPNNTIWFKAPTPSDLGAFDPGNVFRYVDRFVVVYFPVIDAIVTQAPDDDIPAFIFWLRARDVLEKDYDTGLFKPLSVQNRRKWKTWKRDEMLDCDRMKYNATRPGSK